MILVMIRELVTLLNMFVEDLLQFAENASFSSSWSEHTIS